jgi:hypothetical protein
VAKTVNVQTNPNRVIALILMPSRCIEVGFVIDTNRINARGGQPNMTQIEKWHRDGVISLVISDIAFGEVGKGCGGCHRHEKASELIRTGTTKLRTAEEFELLNEIENIIFPAGTTKKNQENDVWIVFNAHKYGDILITEDHDILEKRESLLGLGVFGIKTDAEAVIYIQEQIKSRDERARQVASLTGADLPNWVGQD